MKPILVKYFFRSKLVYSIVTPSNHKLNNFF